MNEFALGAKSTDGRTDGTDNNISDLFSQKSAHMIIKRDQKTIKTSINTISTKIS